MLSGALPGKTGAQRRSKRYGSGGKSREAAPENPAELCRKIRHCVPENPGNPLRHIRGPERAKIGAAAETYSTRPRRKNGHGRGDLHGAAAEKSATPQGYCKARRSTGTTPSAGLLKGPPQNGHYALRRALDKPSAERALRPPQNGHFSLRCAAKYPCAAELHPPQPQGFKLHRNEFNILTELLIILTKYNYGNQVFACTEKEPLHQ